MGYTIPPIVDQALDLIGISFPNVDEDDYYDMADSLREFGKNFKGHGGDAHKAFTRILSSSEGYAVDAMEKHWSHVKAGHLEKIPEIADLFADGCEIVAKAIFAMKRKAEVELVILAGTVVAELAAAGFTFGISAAAAAGQVVLMKQIVNRLVKEAIQEITSQLAAKLTEPVVAKLEEMAVDAVLDLAEGAFNPQGEPGGGMALASAGGGGGSGSAGKKTVIDHLEFEDGAGKVSRHGGELKNGPSTHLSKSKTTFGRSKGKDSFTSHFDELLGKAYDAMDKAVDRATKHVTETIPKKVKDVSKVQKENDQKVGKDAENVDVKGEQNKKNGETRTYILNADGSVSRLLPNGTLDSNPLDDTDRANLRSILNSDGTVNYPSNADERAKWNLPRNPKHEGKVKSQRVATGHELARAVELARMARNDYSGINYAAGTYIDPRTNNTSILVGHSVSLSSDNYNRHSERSIGVPLLESGISGGSKEDSGLRNVFTERAPCQTGHACEKWLNRHFGDIEVTHAVEYDQSTPRSDREKLFKEYLAGLERRR